MADRITAVVARQLITISDIRLERDTATMNPSVFMPFQSRREDPFRFVIELYILKHLAGKVPLYKPDPNILAQRLQSLSKQWYKPSNQKIRALHAVDKARLRNLVSTLMIAEKYAQRNIGNSRIDSSLEIQKHYNRWIDQLVKESYQEGIFRLVNSPKK